MEMGDFFHKKVGAGKIEGSVVCWVLLSVSLDHFYHSIICVSQEEASLIASN